MKAFLFGFSLLVSFSSFASHSISYDRKITVDPGGDDSRVQVIFSSSEQAGTLTVGLCGGKYVVSLYKKNMLELNVQTDDFATFRTRAPIESKVVFDSGKECENARKVLTKFNPRNGKPLIVQYNDDGSAEILNLSL